MEEFVNLAYVLSYAGMVIVTVFLTQALKKLFTKWKPQHIALAAAIVLCAVAAVFYGSFETAKTIIETVLTWTLNAFIVWFAAMKSYETTHQSNTPPEG